MTEQETPQAASAADKPLPDGVVGIISPAGVEARAKRDAAEEKKAALTVTIRVFEDGSQSVDTQTADGRPVPLGQVRDLFKICKEHYDDRLMAHMVKVEVSRAVAEAAKTTKDRNLMAKLFHALR